MQDSSYIRRALGIERIVALFTAYREQTRNVPPEGFSTVLVCGAVLIATIPVIGYAWFHDRDDVDLVTFGIGFAAVLSMIYRVRLGIQFPSVKDWKECLKHTHTAFALGCIPFVLIAVFFPTLLETFVSMKEQTASPGAPQPNFVQILVFILGVSVWAGLTEEVIYRGLLVSVLRRWQAISSQPLRDLFAVTASALIFGLGHLPLWGPGMSLSLVGLGLGFGVAYIAIGEKMLPLIVYHIIFDAVSLSVSVFSFSG